MNTNFQSLHEKAVQIYKSYLRAESDLIAVLQEIDECRGYRELQCKSLFEYATQCLKLSESVSYNLITIARKSREVPKLQEMIQKREMTVSNARMIAPVLTSQNQEKWLSAAASLSKRDLEKEIAKTSPELAVQERVRFVAHERLEVKIGISEALHQRLKHVQDLLSSRLGENADLEKTLEALVDFYIEKKDPVEKARRSKTRQDKGNELKKTEQPEAHHSKSEAQKTEIVFMAQPVPGQVRAQAQARTQQRYIPARLEHAIRLRDQGRCGYKNANGQRCDERRWLDIHHITPLSHGGSTTFENLTLLCRGHHQLLHHQAAH